MQKQIRILSTVMAALLLNGCAVKIWDFKGCSPVPGTDDASCDWFLHSEPTIENWAAVQAAWQAQGFTTVCTSSQAYANQKGEIEQLCSESTCTDEVATQQQNLLRGADRMIHLR